MAVINIPIPESGLTTEQLANLLAQVIKEVQWLVNGNLDVNNIRANSVNADRIKANTITATQIAANTITADKMSVTQLSAIAADLGTITAGIIYGAYIATSNGTYPRTEMSTTGNQFAALQSADKYVKMDPAASGSNPGFTFQNGVGVTALLYLLTTDYFIATPTGSANIQISSGKDLFLTANNILKLSGTSLQMNGTTGYTGSFVAGTKTVTVNNGIITSVV